MSKTAEQITAAANETAAEIIRVATANANAMKSAAAVASNLLITAKSTKNVDKLFQLADNAAAAANAAEDINSGKARRDSSFACELSRKARRTAGAYKAAATRAGYTAESIERRDAADEAAQAIQSAFYKAERMRGEGNRAMNQAIDDAREIIRLAKLTAAAQKANEIRANYPATDEATAADIIRRELDTRSKDIDAAAQDWRRAMPTNEYVAVKVAAATFASDTIDEEEAAATETSADHAETYADAAEYAERNATAAEARAFADYAAEAARDAARTARYHRCHCYRDHESNAFAARAVEDERKHVQRADLAADRAAAAAARAEHRALTSKANAAALALLDAYAEAIGEYPAEDDPETRAVYAVAHGAIAHAIGSTSADHRTVSDMTEAIANRVREDAAEDAAARAAFATRPAADLSKYDGMPHLQTEPAPAETYQRAELLDYLGDATAYDLAAIEAEATETDPATGRQVWRRGADLAAIAERHELYSYAPAI